MIYTPKYVKNTYLSLLLFNTLAASFIWGINTIFLLEAGLSNFEAFTANAFFTIGMVLFEVPTGIVADTRGRQTSFMLGAATLIISTFAYFVLWGMGAPFWMWAIASLLLGLGFTFFSGALEAWVVDALQFTGYKGDLDTVFAKGQVVTGFAMLAGSIAGGFIAQITNLGVPYLIRAALLVIALVVAFMYMKDLGFKPERSAHVVQDIKNLLNSSIEHGFKNPPVRWLMLAAVFTGAIGFYVFYAMQPYLLELYGDSKAYTIAGLVAAIVAGAQITGGLLAPYIRNLFKKRTDVLIVGTAITAVMLLLSGLISNFLIVVFLLMIWGLVFAATTPIRQAYLNGMIPSKQRATVLSFDSLMSSSGGIVSQPVLGRMADTYSYAPTFVISAVVHSIALPLLAKSKAQNNPADLRVTKQ